jgi:hypothetical protein
MSKKPFIVMLLAAAVLSLACLCYPTALAGLFETPTAIPPTPTATFTPEPTLTASPTAEYVPVCARDLNRLLQASENGYTHGNQLDKDVLLVQYRVNGDTLSDPDYAGSVPVGLRKDQKNTVEQQKIWDFIVAILPAEQRKQVKQFVFYTDGANGSLGAVTPLDNPHDWGLELDLVDARNFPDLATTVIHEFAHLVTLNDTQVPPDMQVFYNPDSREIFDQQAAKCTTYFTMEGCSKVDSYLYAFFIRFWPEIYDEWKPIDNEGDPDTQEADLDSFYQEYADQFVSNYAATSPEEDLAETFTYFIFEPKPAPDSIADRKVLFLYEYPELVSLRQTILERLCGHLELP